MKKSKSSRIIVTLECLCKYSVSKEFHKIPLFRYTTVKNRRNTSNKLKLKKFCPQCNRHSLFQETK
uniref:Ribosomal protein L33 n=1 Tax=Apophlaea sinclairii TaxID=212746 RepID=A0A1C9CBI1_9FLOR|nr:ribosomal protein L33 [Apophlaea sinclairii]AOM65725.1 ribosomal protein L33 [Apophlaea sinclairii]